MRETTEREECRHCPLGRASLPEPCPFHEAVRPVGSVFIAQGEVPANVWLIKSGVVLLSSVSANGEELSCGVRGPGSMIGLEALRGLRADYAAWTLTEVTACHLGTDSFRTWTSASGPVAAVLDLALDEIARHMRERVALAGRTVQRVARFLLLHHRAVGEQPLRIEQQILARMLGMRAETLSRAVHKLRDAGALGDERGVHIVDAVRLAEVAGDDSLD